MQSENSIMFTIMKIWVSVHKTHIACHVHVEGAEEWRALCMNVHVCMFYALSVNMYMWLCDSLRVNQIPSKKTNNKKAKSQM